MRISFTTPILVNGANQYDRRKILQVSGMNLIVISVCCDALSVF
jgi:hypothetical protein